MSVVVPLPESDLDRFADIVANAYPAFSLGTSEERDRFRKNMGETHEDPDRCIYGLYREGQLLGGMIFYDFRINLFSAMNSVGGVGLVAVDLLHKKEKVAKEMIEFFLAHYEERGFPLTMLYPFRPDFYKKMGFGYGTKVNQYRFSPASLPRGESKAHIRFLKAEDKGATADCYNRVVERTHGMTYKPDYHWRNLFEQGGGRIVGYEQDGRLQGYLTYSFDKGKSFLHNDLVINEMFYENREVLSELLTFLHSQADQVKQIVYSSHDDTFHHLLFDPTNGTGNLFGPISHESNIQGVGLMYRIINMPGIFEAMAGRNFGGQSCRLRVVLQDTFFPQQAGSTVVHFEDGRAALAPDGDYEVEMSLDVSEFSSLLMGVISFRKLYDYSLVQVSDPAYLDLLHRLFFTETKPICITRF
ncbi:MAG: GNAT family N-acetyltransferase [Candidatus Promineifilaceae bacterium]